MIRVVPFIATLPRSNGFLTDRLQNCLVELDDSDLPTPVLYRKGRSTTYARLPEEAYVNLDDGITLRVLTSVEVIAGAIGSRQSGGPIDHSYIGPTPLQERQCSR